MNQLTRDSSNDFKKIFNLDDFKGSADSFEDSLLPLKNLFYISDVSIDQIKRKCCKSDDKILTNDESAAIYLYTLDEDSTDFSLRLNAALKSRNQQEIEPWKKFLRLFLSALGKIPDSTGRMWFESTNDFLKEIQINGRLSSVIFISGTLTPSYLQNRSKRSTASIVCVEFFHGKNIQRFSSDQNRTQILLVPGVHLRLIDILRKDEIRSETTDRNDRSTNQFSEQSQRSQIASRPIHTDVTDSAIVKIYYGNPYSVTTFENGDRYEIRYDLRGQELFVTFFTFDGRLFFNDQARQFANGEGIRTWSNGDQYRGTIKNGQIHDFGQLKCANGYSYVGFWFAGKAHGEGRSKWSNGDYYKGRHQDGELTGYGEFRTAKNDIYRGFLVEGKAQGDGERIWPNGNRYAGEFKDDKKHGEGKFTFASGGVYLGHWLDDKMDGYGQLKWPSGNVYRGHFRMGQLDGEGTIFFTNGRYQFGIWKKDRLIQRVE